MKSRLYLSALLLLASLPGVAGEFRLLEAADAALFEKRLNAAADDGQHALAVTRGLTADGRERLLALMQARTTGGAESYRVVVTSGDLRSTPPAEALSLLDHGHRLVDVITRPLPDWWLPERSYDDQLLWILAGPASTDSGTHELISLSSPSSGNPALSRSNRRVLRLVAGGRRVHALLDSADARRANETPRYRVLAEARRGHLRRALTRAAKDGFSVVDAVPATINAPQLVLLERQADRSPQTFKMLSKPLDRYRRGRLRAALTALGDDGYRLLPSTLTGDSWIAQRDASGKRTPIEYRLIDSRDGDVASLVSESSRDGFAVVSLLSTPAETMILMQRERPTSN